jgi:hypothetical protein
MSTILEDNLFFIYLALALAVVVMAVGTLYVRAARRSGKQRPKRGIAFLRILIIRTSDFRRQRS